MQIAGAKGQSRVQFPSQKRASKWLAERKAALLKAREINDE
jgi:hypothetical protein